MIKNVLKNWTGSVKDKMECIMVLVYWASLPVAVLAALIALIGKPNYHLFAASAVYLVFAAVASYNRIPEVNVGMPVSFILGRVWSVPDEQGFSRPIGKPVGEGVSFTYPWRRYVTFLRDTDPLEVPLRKYQTKQGSVFVKGLITIRPTGLVVTRLAEIEDRERKSLLLARVNKIIRSMILTKDLEDALNMKDILEQEILSEMNGPAKVGTDDRVLFGRTVSFSENQFGLVVMNIALDDIDPTEEIQKRRDALIVEKLKVKQRKTQLQADTLIKEKYPDLSDNERLAALQILDGDTPATREIKTTEIAELDKVLGAVKDIAAMLAARKKD
jgi:hypothetical protein